MMKKLLLSSSLLLALSSPVLADPARQSELRRDRQDIRTDQHQLGYARRHNTAQVDQRRDDLRDSRREYRDDRHDQQADRRYYGDNGDRDRHEWRHDGPRFHGAVNYGYPHGRQYQYWAPNVRLPRSYWASSRYWINDPFRYQLIRPWPGTRWVQVGPDALLISIRDGVVISIVRGLFYSH